MMAIPIIKDILEVATVLKASKLEEKKLAKVEDELERLQEYLSCNRIQAILIVLVFEMNTQNNHPDLDDLASHLKCSSIQLIMHLNDIKKLELQKLLLHHNDRFPMFRKSDVTYKINPSVYDAIIANRPINIVDDEPIENPMDIIIHLAEMIDERESQQAPTKKLWAIVLTYLNKRKDCKICQVLKNLEFGYVDILALIYIMARNIDNRSNLTVESLASTVIEKRSQRRSYELSIEQGNNALIHQKWVENNGASFFSSSEVVITQKTVDYFKPFGVELKIDKKRPSTIKLLSPNKISKKHLYFNVTENIAIENLQASLKYRKHQQIVKALKKEGMRAGICTLYYGAPGTGKTESVYQIAKATGRSVWKVDISELKTMWYGESQKLVKKLFTDYKNLCLEEKRTPILLLNEADAILGKRNPNGFSSTDKADNAIQNIFLDNLEDFEGILFATTNLEESLDKAFERRFLFKLKFDKPKPDTQIKIWKSKIKGIRLSEIKVLAKQFDLTGGEIENIVRKLKMDNVLNGASYNYEKLFKFCSQEKLDSKPKSSLGFKKST